MRLEPGPRGWMGGGGGGGYSDIFICRLGSFFGAQNFEFQYFGGFSEFFFLGEGGGGV